MKIKTKTRMKSDGIQPGNLTVNSMIMFGTLVVFMSIILGLSACAAPQDDNPVSTSSGENPAQPQDPFEPTQVQELEVNQPTEDLEEELHQDDQVSEVEEIAPTDPQEIQALWSESAHADTFILDDAGNNNTCARCHSPIVWLPSMDDMPESCFACKFEVDDPPPLIAETDWVQIDCSVCHEVDKKGNVAPEYTWLEIAQIGEYAEVTSASELCLKCHIDSGVPGHAVPQPGGAHAGYECTVCHEAHGLSASCTSSGCHEDVDDPQEPIPGHDQEHELVSCAACHDSGEMVVDFDEQQGMWITFANDPVGEDQYLPMVSHNTVLAAPCDRCHFEGNPWDLSTGIE